LDVIAVRVGPLGLVAAVVVVVLVVVDAGPFTQYASSNQIDTLGTNTRVPLVELCESDAKFSLVEQSSQLVTCFITY
jgi:hypothetical protein